MNCFESLNIKPSSFGRRVFLSLLLFTAVISLPALTPGDELEVAVVQFQVSSEIIRSEEVYYDALDRAMAEALKDGPADLVVFPEYIGVFASLIPWYPYLRNQKSFESVWAGVRKDHPDLRYIRDLFIREAKRTDAWLDKIWGELAVKYDCYILSGSRFNGRRNRLYNQAVVYNPKGRVIYRQDKHFLTEFELQILGLNSGSMTSATGFDIKDYHINLTICRDTFLNEWEEVLDEGDLWIDIKANGVEYTEDQEELFTRALPARLGNTEVPYGITACLTGDFLDLFWEGESSFIYNDSGRIRYLEVSEETDSFEIIRETLP